MLWPMHNGGEVNNNKPFVSVVICTRNRERHLGRALQSLTEQDFDPAGFEIIVVDNHSTDGTLALARKFRDEHPGHNIRVVQEPTKGLTFARNRGIAESKGTYIAFIDDDAVAPVDYVKNIARCAREYGNRYQACGGKVLPLYETGKPPAWMSRYIQRVISITDWGDKPKVLRRSYPVGCNMFFHRDFFDRVGMFSTDLYTRSDDKYIFFKARKEGIPVLYYPAVWVEHFIEKKRYGMDYVRRVSYINGLSNRMMIRSLYEKPLIPLLCKGTDLVIKLIVAAGLWLMFTFRGQPVKGKALFLAIWNNLKGFLLGRPSE